MRTTTLVLLAAFSLATCDRCGAGEPAPSASASAPVAAPAPPFSPLELDDAALAENQRFFSYHDVMRAPAYRVSVAPAAGATIVFLRLPDVARGAFSAPSLAVVQPLRSALEVELVRWDEGNLAAVEAFDLRDTDGDGRAEMLFFARFEPRKDREGGSSFRRAFHIAWNDEGRPLKTLASWALRHDTSLASIDDLARDVTDFQRRRACPALAKDMDEDTTVLALRCMVENDRRRDLADSVAYPLEVLLRDGHVRSLHEPEDLLEVYDDVIDANVREALRAGKFELGYWGRRIGRGGPIVEEGKIQAIFSLDADAHRRLRERLATDERDLWRARPGDVLCRTKRATHVFSHDLARSGGRRFQLATWDDPKAAVRKSPPDRVVFGILEMHGTCGNDDYTFVGPGPDLGFHHVACYGPWPEPEYSITGPDGDEPCQNHPILR